MKDKKVNETMDTIFSYEVKKEKKVFIYWYDKLVKILSGEKALIFLSKVRGAYSMEEQHLMAKVTGNFKRKKDDHTRTIVIRGSFFTKKKD